MDNHLMVCMLSNYRALYIKSELEAGMADHLIWHVVHNDIEPAISYYLELYEKETAELLAAE